MSTGAPAVPPPTIAARNARLHNAGIADQRGDFERDKDRIHYSSAFRRLGGVSQVVSSEHIEPFHNRLTHTTKVAQLGRRLAQHIGREQAGKLGIPIDPEVVEAACLAHDLGHPPFGHVGESALNALARTHGDEEGYEGNAQSFRVITKLALRSVTCPGLDLTRAVLAASIKYPWAYSEAETRQTRKFGYFQTEKADFDFAREGQSPGIRSVEAQIMDYADDIAYSVHDLEDFHRIRAVPWHMLRVGEASDPESQMGDIIVAALEDWYDRPSNAREVLAAAARNVMGRTEAFPQIHQEPYEGTREQRISLRNWTSDLIRRYVHELCPQLVIDNGVPSLKLHPDADAEIRLLKQITRAFVIDGPTIGAQQKGQRRVVEDVYHDVIADIEEATKRDRAPRIVPKRFQYLIAERNDGATLARLAADCIASLTENELVALHQRLKGLVGGSITDPIIR